MLQCILAPKGHVFSATGPLLILLETGSPVELLWNRQQVWIEAHHPSNCVLPVLPAMLLLTETF